MPTRRNATTTSAGILRPEEFARHVSVERTEPASRLTPWVEYHWTLQWQLSPGATFRSAVVPHPSCNVTVERGALCRPEAAGEELLVTGVTTHRFDVDVHDHGWVHGLKLRPGALTALTGHDAKTLVDRTVAAKDVLPQVVHEELDDLIAGMSAADATAAASVALEPLLPGTPDPSYELLLRVVSDMLAERSILRVDEIVERHSIGRRALERLFARYVGVGPKWVLARYRMHDVVTSLDEGYAGSLADLAATFGWFDQAHFARDFTALVGCPPSTYRRHVAP